MRLILLLLTLTMLSVGAFAGEYTTSWKTITHNSTHITDVEGSFNSSEMWSGDTEIRTDVYVLQLLFEEDGTTQVIDPWTLEQSEGLVWASVRRKEDNVTGTTKVVDGAFAHTSTTVTLGRSHIADADGMGAGGGHRNTVITISDPTGEYVVETDVSGDFEQTNTTTTWVDYDLATGVTDGVYDTEVSYAKAYQQGLQADDLGWSRDSDVTYTVNGTGFSDVTTIDEIYTTAYSDFY